LAGLHNNGIPAPLIVEFKKLFLATRRRLSDEPGMFRLLSHRTPMPPQLSRDGAFLASRTVCTIASFPAFDTVVILTADPSPRRRGCFNDVMRIMNVFGVAGVFPNLNKRHMPILC
jgi:hypothetical protein